MSCGQSGYFLNKPRIQYLLDICGEILKDLTTILQLEAALKIDTEAWVLKK